ncbi:MAG: carboxypeptidase regulatory-like domain-containing protein [Bryobacterales bacterium]|nr:carboxypeptidase regulatory-like domain-containing protein [Bryobacterales bacterium]
MPLHLAGQGGSATISGIVQDAHHAVVPGARVQVRHTETNSTRELTASEDGEFTVTNLAPGPYELRVEREGFRTYVQNSIVLELGQVLRAEVHLQLGAVAESIVVSTEATLINTEVGAIKGDVILQQEINDMPLDGRDFTDLAMMVSGVVPMAQGGQGSGLNVNGARSDSTNYSVDGFNNRNPRGAAAQVRPNVGAMQEFKMEVAGFSADTGRMAGGNINMVLRSGTNQFHGDVFEYFRNDIFDARSFFDQRKQSLRRNQFGATVHGPVNIPGLYNGRDRTFFLFSWESYREVLGQSQIGSVPTLLQRQGDFSQSVVPVTGAKLYLRDPLATGTCSATVSTACFPGNRIPASRFHPIALKLLEYYPLPNRGDAANNYISTAKDFDIWSSYVWKIDHRFREKDTVSFRAQLRDADTTNPFAAGAIPMWPNFSDDVRSLAGVDYTHMFSPTLLTEVRAGYSRGATRESTAWQGQDIAAQLGIAGVTNDPVLKGWPRVTIQDYVSLGSVAGQPADYHVTTLLASNKYTWIKNKHVLKWGVDMERVRFNQPFYDNARGTLAFQRNWTQHSVADFLLGMMQTSTRNAQTTRNYLRSFSVGAYFNDDFKVTRTLTLNLGMRYELDMPPVEKYGRASNFVAEFGKIIISDDANLPNLRQRIAQFNLQDRVALAREVGYPRALVYADKINFAPRSGFAWRMPGKATSVLRGGYGIFYTGHLLNPIRTSLMTGFPFSVNQTFTRLATDTTLVTLSNPFPESRATEGNSTNSNGYDPHPPLGYLQSYNLTMERELGGGMALEMGYVGSKGTNLGRQYDINQPLRTMELYQANAVFPRPIAGINTINYYSFGANSNYNAGQISLRRRARGGFYRFNYTISKSIDDASQLSGNSTGGFAGAQNSRDLKSERGRSDFDRRHVVTAVFSTTLPFGRGKRFLKNARGWRGGAVAGWQFSGSATFYSGQAFTVTSANVDTALGESLRPNRIGSGAQRDIAGAGKRGVDYPWFALADFEPVPRCASRTSCEVSPNGFAPFAFGNSGRNILDGPRSHFINVAMMKNFRLAEKRGFQFRYELFNMLNHANLQLPERQFNSLGGGLITGVTDRGRGGPRVMQAALKFEF